MWSYTERKLIEAAKLRIDLFKSDEFIVLSEVNRLNNSFEVVEGNYTEIVDLLEIHKRIDLSIVLRDQKGKNKWKKLQSDLTRSLVNFLSSTAALVDHQRAFYRRWLQTQNKVPSYSFEIDKRFTNNTNHLFLKDLRNFALHSSVPQVITNTSLSDKSIGPITRLTLKSSELMERGSKWCSNSRKFLESRKSVDVEAVLNEYYTDIESFHQWLKTELNTAFKAERAIVKKREKHIKQLNQEFRLCQFADNINNQKQDGLTAILNDILSKYFLQKLTNSITKESEFRAILASKYNLETGIVEKLVKSFESMSTEM